MQCRRLETPWNAGYPMKAPRARTRTRGGMSCFVMFPGERDARGSSSQHHRNIIAAGEIDRGSGVDTSRNLHASRARAGMLRIAKVSPARGMSASPAGDRSAMFRYAVETTAQKDTRIPPPARSQVNKTEHVSTAYRPPLGILGKLGLLPARSLLGTQKTRSAIDPPPLLCASKNWKIDPGGCKDRPCPACNTRPPCDDARSHDSTYGYGPLASSQGQIRGRAGADRTKSDRKSGYRVFTAG